MLPHRLPRPLRLALYALASAILLWMTLAPQQDLPQAGLGDKWEHAIAWFVLASFGLALSPRRPLAIAAYCLGFAVAVELLQMTMGFGRHGDWRDLAADALGVAAAFAVAWPLRRVVGSKAS
jgi:VanZ family protein